jgi:uncharacterized protein YecE (DUF72 family)
MGQIPVGLSSWADPQLIVSGFYPPGLQPLHSAGKLGPVSFQFPSWFHPDQENYEYISKSQEKLSDTNWPLNFGREAG